MALGIRWRLTFGNAFTLAVLFLAFGGLVYGLLARSLYQRVDQSLQTVLNELARRPDQDLPHWIDEALDHEKVYCIVFDQFGTLRARTDVLAEDSIPPPSPAPASPESRVVVLPLIGRQRQLTVPVRWRGEALAVVLLAPLEEVDRELAQLRGVLFMIVPAALVAAGACGWWQARQALKPVAQLTRLAEETTADRLDRRLPVEHADELGRLASTINSMIARLERSFSEVRRFTADASHELRTPLTALRVELEAALRRDLTPAEAQQLLASLLEECAQLTRLTDQLLTLSREDAGPDRASWDEVDLPALVGQSVETMRPFAEARQLRLALAEGGRVRVRGDATRLRQVCYNLLDNAIKYTPGGGRVDVQVERSGGLARVVVRDTGIGIPAEHLPHIFDRFYRVDKARSRAEGGTGLGLSIAQSVARSHEGAIEIRSTVGEGTVCTVTLPALVD